MFIFISLTIIVEVSHGSHTNKTLESVNKCR